MDWKQVLDLELDQAYTSTARLFDMVDDDKMEWKPETGENWMNVGQLLRHITESCGAGFKGFVEGDWGLPPGKRMEDLPPEEMLPAAEKLSALESISAAKKGLSRDETLARLMLEKCSEKDLAEKPAPAPWDPKPVNLGHRLLQMIGHLNQHKAQLFYYLKLQGKAVNTGHLYGSVE